MSEEQKADIRHDLSEYFAKEESLSLNSRKKLLNNIFEKHLIFKDEPLSLNMRDYEFIVGGAKSMFSKKNLPITISGKDLDETQLLVYFVIESTLSFLNSKNVLKNVPQFERKEKKK